MINPEEWMPSLAERLKSVFGGRLLYLGLQGSYGRGEATESSDIDVVAVVNAFSLRDLDLYRAAVREMPEGKKACGFFGGKEEFLAWPRHEMFSLKIDTADWFGRLDDFLPPIGRDDIVAALRVGAAGLYHPLVHTYLYGDETAVRECARGVFKGAYFLLRIRQYLRAGELPSTKKALCEALSGDEREILRAGMPGSDWMERHSAAEACELLLEWTRGLLRE